MRQGNPQTMKGDSRAPAANFGPPPGRIERRRAPRLADMNASYEELEERVRRLRGEGKPAT